MGRSQCCCWAALLCFISGLCACSSKYIVMKVLVGPSRFGPQSNVCTCVMPGLETLHLDCTTVSMWEVMHTIDAFSQGRPDIGSFRNDIINVCLQRLYTHCTYEMSAIRQLSSSVCLVVTGLGSGYQTATTPV